MQAELDSIRFRSNPLCTPVLNPCRPSCPIISVDGLFSLLDSMFCPIATLYAPPAAIMMMTIMHMHHARLDRRSTVLRLYPPDLSRKKSLNKQSGLRCYKVLIFSQIRQMARGGFLFIYEHVMVCEGYDYLGSGVPRQAGSASRSFGILFYFTFLFSFSLPYSSFLIASGWDFFLCLSLRFFLIYLEDICTTRRIDLFFLLCLTLAKYVESRHASRYPPNRSTN